MAEEKNAELTAMLKAWQKYKDAEAHFKTAWRAWCGNYDENPLLLHARMKQAQNVRDVTRAVFYERAEAFAAALAAQDKEYVEVNNGNRQLE